MQQAELPRGETLYTPGAESSHTLLIGAICPLTQASSYWFGSIERVASTGLPVKAMHLVLNQVHCLC
jgi:hypothetical protein